MIDSQLPGRMGRLLPVRMTALRLPGGDLLLHSPTRYSPALGAELAALGSVRHLVAPNFAHWMFLQEWQRALPGVTTWAARGLRQRRPVQRSGVRLDHELGDTAPAEWGDAIGLTTIRGAFGFHEAALFHRPSATLVLTDLVLNLEPEKLPGWFRPLARGFGVTAPDGMPPPYVRAMIKRYRQEGAQQAAALVALAPRLVLFAHGRPFDQDAPAALRRSLRWLLP